MSPTLASPCGRIGAAMSPSDWATCAWISWPLLVAVVGLDVSLIVFRIVWRDLIFALRVTCIGRLRLEAEPRALEGRLLPQISEGWDRIAATQRRRLVCPLGAGVPACVGPLWPRQGAAVRTLKGRFRPPPRVQKKNQQCLGSLAPSGLCRNTVVLLFGTGVACTFPLPVASWPSSFGPQGWFISCSERREKTSTVQPYEKIHETCGQLPRVPPSPGGGLPYVRHLQNQLGS